MRKYNINQFYMKYGLYPAIWFTALFSAHLAFGQITLTFTADQPSCFGFTNGNITVHPVGGADPYTYHWENGQNGQTNMGVAAGVYQVTVTDHNGIVATGAGTISQPAALSASITPSGFGCEPIGTLSATENGGTAPFSYTWSNGSSAAAINVNTGGLYYLTVTDANDCQAIDNEYVVPSIYVDVQVTNIPCSTLPNGGAVLAAVAGGQNPYTFHWNTGATTQVVENLPQGSYTVTITDTRNCDMIASGTINQPDPISVSVTINAPACGGNNGSATLQASGGTAPYRYIWVTLGNAQGATQNNLAPGSYYVCTYDANNCQKDVNVVIPVSSGLDVNVVATKALCPGQNTGTATAIVTPAGNYHYTWNIQPNSNFAMINGIGANTLVIVTVTDPVTGCMGIDSAVVGTHEQVKLTVADIDVLCLGDTLGSATAQAYQGTMPYHYVWYSNQDSIGTGSVIMGLSVGAYGVIVTDDHGCTAAGVADITAQSGPKAEFEIKQLECVGDSVEIQLIDHSTDALGTLNQWDWQITPDDGSPVIHLSGQHPANFLMPDSQTGIIQLTVTSSIGCTAQKSLRYKVSGVRNFQVTLGAPTFTCNNLPVPITVTGDTSYTYVWSALPGLDLTNAPFHVIANPSVNTTYSLNVSNGLCDTVILIEIKRAEPINVVASPDSTVTCMSSIDFTATANAASNATFFWLNSDSVQIATGPVLNTLISGNHTFTVIATDSNGCTDSDFVTVTGNAVDIQVQLSKVGDPCNPGPVQIIVTGNPIYTYNWTPDPTLDLTNAPFNAVANPPITTTYTLYVNNGVCDSTFHITVERPLPINLSVESNNVVTCLPIDTLRAFANAGVPVTYQWFENGVVVGSGANLQVETNGVHTYTVVATDANGCTDSEQVSVTNQSVVIQIQLTQTGDLCNPGPVQITITGDPAFTYNWTPDPTLDLTNAPFNVVANPPISTTYALYVNNGVCDSTFLITVERALPINLSVESNNVVTCLPIDTLRAFANAGVTVTYQWFENGVAIGSGANLQVETNGVHTYTVVATDANGCTDSEQVTVTGQSVAVQIQLTQTGDLCNPGPVQITITGDPAFTYNWTPDPTLDLSGAPLNAVANPTVTTTYTLHVGNGVCDSVYHISVERPTPINLSVESNNVVTCLPIDTLRAFANAGVTVTYQWFENGVAIGSGANLQVETNGVHTYTVVATDANGCTDSEQVTVTGQSVAVQIQLTQTGDLCNPGPVQITITGDPAFTYNWTPDPTLDLSGAPLNAVANPTVTTTYTLHVGNGVCDSIYHITVERPLPINLSVESNNVVTCLPIDTLRAFANAGVTVTYQWFENGVAIGSGANFQVETNGIHVYTVVATDINGCTDSEQVTVSVQSVAVQIELTQTGDICHPGPVQITVTGDPAFTYNWTPDPTLDLNGAPFHVVANPALTTTYTLKVSNGVCDSTYQITVERAPQINLSVESNNVASCQALDTLNAVVNTTLSVTLEWFENGIKIGDGPALEIATNGTHTYTVIATASNGCTESEQVTVTNRSLNISLNTTLPNTDCEQTPIPVCVVNLIPSDTLSYQWDGPAGITIDPSNTACVYVTGPQGDYVVTVTVTNQYGCSDTLHAPVHFLQSTSLDGKILVDLCNGRKVKFFNNSNITGTWSFGDNTQDTVKNPVHIYAIGDTTYHVFFTPDQTNFPCIQRFDTIINVIEFPALQADFTDTLKSCEIIATVQFTDKTVFYNPIASWEWTFSNDSSSTVQNPLVTFVNEGMFDATLIVTDINGCRDTAMHPIKVNLVEASLADTLTICPGDSVALNLQFVPNYTFEWHSSPSDPDFDPTIKNPFVSPADTTIYTATVINGVCIVNYQAVVNPVPPVNIDLMAVDTVLCNEAPITILINNPNVTNIEWYNNPGLTTVIGNGTSYTIDPVKSQVLYVKAHTTIGECPALDSIKIDNQTIKLGVAPYDQQICVGSFATLFVNVTTNHPGTLSYAWTPVLPSNGSPVVSPTTNTTYTVTVTNQALCTVTAEYHVNVLDTISVKAEIVGPDTLFPGETAILLATATGGTGPISYEWFPQTWLSNPYAAQTESTPSDSITYWVIAQSDGRCPDTAWVHLEYRSDDCKEPYIFVPKAFTPNGDNFNDFFIVRGANITELEFIVWDRWGEIVYRTTDLNAQGWDGTQNGKELTPDAYAWYCRVKCGSGAEYITKGDVTLLK